MTVFVFELVSQMPVLPQVVFFAALLVGGVGIVGPLGHLGRYLWARHQLSQESESESGGRVTIHEINISNLTVTDSGRQVERPRADEQATTTTQQAQSWELTPSGHPASQPLPPDAATRTPFRNLSFRITELESESPRMIHDRVFEDCFIHGPAIFVLDQSPLYQADFTPRDVESLLWDTGSRTSLAGVVAIKHCVFRRCTFVAIGFAGPPQFIQEFREALEAANASQ